MSCLNVFAILAGTITIGFTDKTVDDLYKNGIARKCRACSNARGREYRLRRKLKGAAT